MLSYNEGNVSFIYAYVFNQAVTNFVLFTLDKSFYLVIKYKVTLDVLIKTYSHIIF